MKPLEAVQQMREALSGLLDEYGEGVDISYYESMQQVAGMLSLLEKNGPAICDKDRASLEKCVLAEVHDMAMFYCADWIDDDTALPDIFAEVEAMLKDGHDGAAPDGS